MDPQYFFHLNDEVVTVPAQLELTPKAGRNISTEEDFHNLFLSPSPYKRFTVRASPGNGFASGFNADPILCQGLGGVVGHSEEEDLVYASAPATTPRQQPPRNQTAIEQVFSQLQEQQIIPMPMQRGEEIKQSQTYYQLTLNNGQNLSVEQFSMQQDLVRSISPNELSKVPKRKRTSRNRSNKKKGGIAVLIDQDDDRNDVEMLNVMDQSPIDIISDQQIGGSTPQDISMEPMPIPMVDSNGEPVTNDLQIIPSGQQVAMSRLLYPFPAQSRRPSRNPQCCNCRKSGCMKLYCVCFSNGMYCSDSCNCTDCKNDITNCVAIKAAWENIIEQNPSGSLHCKCRKSRCRKSYCKCYEAGHKCGPWCGCVGCNNTEEGLKIEDQRQKSLKPNSSDINDTSEETKSQLQYLIPGSDFNGGALVLPLDTPYHSNMTPMMISQNNSPLTLAPPPNFSASTLPPPPLSTNSGQTGPIVILPHEVTDQGLPTGNLTLGYLQKSGPNVFKFFSTTPDQVQRIQAGGSAQLGLYGGYSGINQPQNNNSIMVTPNHGNSEQTAMYSGQVDNHLQSRNPYHQSYQFATPKIIGGNKQIFVTDEISYNKYPPVYINYHEQEQFFEDTTTMEEDEEPEDEDDLDCEEPIFTPENSRPALPLLTPLGQDGLLPVYHPPTQQQQQQSIIIKDQTSPLQQLYSDATTQSIEEDNNNNSPNSQYMGSIIKIGQPVTSSEIVRGFPVDYYADKTHFLDHQPVNQLNSSSSNNNIQQFFNQTQQQQQPQINNINIINNNNIVINNNYNTNENTNNYIQQQNMQQCRYDVSNAIDENEEFNQFIANFRIQHFSETDISLDDILDENNNTNDHSNNNNNNNTNSNNNQQYQSQQLNEGYQISGGNIEQQFSQGYKDFQDGQSECIENQQFINDIPINFVGFNLSMNKKALQNSSVQNSPMKTNMKSQNKREMIPQIF